jgi:hypothetical protein
MSKKKTFVSRITGKITEVGERKTLNEQPENNPQIEAFALVAECFRLNGRVQDKSGLKYLYDEWRFPKKTIKKYFEYFGNSYDETNHFLDILDGCDSDEKEAMKRYESENNIVSIE